MASTTSTVRETTFKKWAFFSSDFSIETESGIVIVARCKYCSSVDYEKLIGEAKRRGLRGQSLTSLLSYREDLSYIHHKTLSRHVGDANSMHNWCKKTVNPDIVTNPLSTEPGSSKSTSQQRVDEMVIGSSFDYYYKIFTSVMFIAEEEMSFLKLKPLMLLQIKNGVKLGSMDKFNEMACAGMIDVLAEVVMEFVKNVFENVKFMTVSCDASEASDASEEKELV